jgi:hypothetical protein
MRNMTQTDDELRQIVMVSIRGGSAREISTSTSCSMSGRLATSVISRLCSFSATRHSAEERQYMIINEDRTRLYLLEIHSARRQALRPLVGKRGRQNRDAKAVQFTTGDAVLPEASSSDGGNITPTVAGAAGVLLGNKMPSASVDTGRVTFPTTPISWIRVLRIERSSSIGCTWIL